MKAEIDPITTTRNTFDASVIEPWQLSLSQAGPAENNPDRKNNPEVEPERLPKEDPGIQPNTTPKKEGDDDNDNDDDDDDDDDYEPYTEPEVGDDPDEIRKRTTIM